jgi:hypothetical protein
MAIHSNCLRSLPCSRDRARLPTTIRRAPRRPVRDSIYRTGDGYELSEPPGTKFRQHEPGGHTCNSRRWSWCVYGGSDEVNIIWSLVSYRARVCFGRILLWVSLLLVGRFALANDLNNCERMNTAEFKSPDATWVAHLYGKVCDLGISSSAAMGVPEGVYHPATEQCQHRPSKSELPGHSNTSG